MSNVTACIAIIQRNKPEVPWCHHILPTSARESTWPRFNDCDLWLCRCPYRLPLCKWNKKEMIWIRPIILLRIFFWHRNWPQIWHFIFVPFWSPYLKSLILYILCKIYTNEHEHFPHWIECHNICSPDLKSFLKIMTLKFYREKKKKHTHNRN